MLAELLIGIKGKWLLSYNDVGYIRELYKGFEMIEVEAKYSLGGKGQKQDKYTELMIRNY